MTTMNTEDPADPSVHEQRVLDAAQEARLEDHAYAEGRKDEREATLAEFAGKPMCKPCAEAPAKPPRRTLVYPVLLDDGYMAQVVIPFDLSAAECQRMTAFLAALVVPWRV